MDSTLRRLAAGLGALTVGTASVFALLHDSPVPGRKRLPTHLSETALFGDLSTLAPAPGMIPYEINVPYWSDGAIKQRWMMLPGDGSSTDPSRDRIIVKPGVPWAFPAGTVFVQHFGWAPDQTQPSATRRLETRVLVRDQDAGVYGFSYRWNPAGTDATLIEQPETEVLTRRLTDGSMASQKYDYPAPDECVVCHNQSAGSVLAVNYRQINRSIRYQDQASPVNQFIAWNRTGLLSKALDKPAPLNAWNLMTLPRWVPVPFWAIGASGRLSPTNDETSSLQDRARSYLEANCSSCHSPGIVNADWDARSSTPLNLARLVGGPARIPMLDARNIIEPGSPERSLLYLRVSSALPGLRMPPIGRNTVDEAGVQLLSRWIRSLPASPAR